MKRKSMSFKVAMWLLIGVLLFPMVDVKAGDNAVSVQSNLELHNSLDSAYEQLEKQDALYTRVYAGGKVNRK